MGMATLTVMLIAVALLVLGVWVYRGARRAVRGATCPHCGQANPSGARYCGRCGRSVNAD
jgi:hypothetical protein